MNLRSSSFADGGSIPQRHAFNRMGCDGENLSPQLSWDDVPEGTKSFALVMHDPDAPSGSFYHWVMFNIPQGTRELNEGAGTGKIGSLLHGAMLGHNDFGSSAYGGPCPPPGRAHRYFITLHAIDAEKLPLDKTTTGAKLESMASQHLLAKAEIVGRYARPRS